MREIPKLPQARLYLQAALWGLESLVSQRLLGVPYRFHVIGILASLRAVQHALYNHDRHISPEHNKAVSEWWTATNPAAAKELRFIKYARDSILKEGAFQSYAILSESGTGEGGNRTVTREDYEMAYYVDGVRHDLVADIRAAAAWCERELTAIESKLPPLHAPP